MGMPKGKYECAECGVEFRRYVSLATGRRVFCSRACLGKSKRHGSVQFCAWCDTPFYRRYGEQDIGIAVMQFCSRECYGEWRDDKRTSYPKDGPRHKHRIVAEAILGRQLARYEVVHHVDEDKQNFHPSNLVVFPSQREHARHHFSKHPDLELIRYFSLEEIARREREGRSEQAATGAAL